MIRWAVIGIAVAALVAGFAAVTMIVPPQSPRAGSITVDIPAGASVDVVGARLEEEGVIASARAFAFVAARRSIAVKPGRYVFLTPVYPWVAARLLAKGPPEDPDVTVTIPEGSRLEEIARLLEQAGATDADMFLRLATDPGFARSLLGYAAPGLEGYLFPDTFKFKPDSDPEAVIRRLHARFLEQVAGLPTPAFETHALVTLASIVEREAQLPDERARIAGVYHNRLRVGMRLEADPTVRYALRRWDTSPVLWVDLEVESPFNTYVVAGLPPGPIAAPGRAALEAAAHPLATNEFFFVARGDGGHLFAPTFAEHRANIARVRR
jgi:UPF0755 protein